MSGSCPGALTTLAVTGKEEQRLLVVWFLIISVTTCRSWLSVSVTACLRLRKVGFTFALRPSTSTSIRKKVSTQSRSQKSKILFPRLHTRLQPSRCEVKWYNEVFISAKTDEKGVKCLSSYFKTQGLGHDRPTCPSVGFTEIQNARLKLPSVMFRSKFKSRHLLGHRHSSPHSFMLRPFVHPIPLQPNPICFGLKPGVVFLSSSDKVAPAVAQLVWNAPPPLFFISPLRHFHSSRQADS